MERIFDIGQPVIYVDEHALPRPALLTAIHGEMYVLKEGETVGNSHKAGDTYFPCVNLVFTSADGSKTDDYGRQIERESSVSHKNDSSAHGRYWRWADEEPNPIAVTRR
jgi:hypothetical protein